MNVNKVALLRNARDLDLPSVARAARTCIEAGADGITVHPRPDGRHVRTSDVLEMSALTRELGVELNVEGYPTPSFLELVARVRPAQATLVPDAPGQRTSDHGWDVARHASLLCAAIRELRDGTTRVSLFVEADPAAIAAARDVGADRVELYTAPYASAYGTPRQATTLEAYARAAEAAARNELGVNAGHDLNLDNLGALAARIPTLLEVSIGHALIADALHMGLSTAVRAYLRELGSSSESA